MRCTSARTRLDAFRTGELEPAELNEVAVHIESCGNCRTSLDAIRGLARVAPRLGNGPTGGSPALLADSYDWIEERGETVWVAFNPTGIRLLLRGVSLDEFRSSFTRRFGRRLAPAALPDSLRRQVVAALEGTGVQKPRVAWSDRTTGFEREVLSLLSRIPRGEVRTYEWLARKAGRPRAVRAVGNILARNSVPLVVPCHRVVPTAGGVGNYIFGSAMKRELLRREGVDVDGLDLLTRQGVRYIGSRTTKIACVPTCRDARRIREENRVPFCRPEEATREGFRPCLHCEPFE
jgi:O-6-methylguanine DNA methyltransferase